VRFIFGDDEPRGRCRRWPGFCEGGIESADRKCSARSDRGVISRRQQTGRTTARAPECVRPRGYFRRRTVCFCPPGPKNTTSSSRNGLVLSFGRFQDHVRRHDLSSCSPYRRLGTSRIPRRTFPFWVSGNRPGAASQKNGGPEERSSRGNRSGKGAAGPGIGGFLLPLRRPPSWGLSSARPGMRRLRAFDSARKPSDGRDEARRAHSPP